MAVMSLRWLVAVLVWLPAVSAGLEREHPNLWAPIETPGPKPEAEIGLGTSPAVTARPAVRAPILDVKRNDNTCGYLNGVKSSASAYICNAPDAVCLYNSVASAVGCCLPEGCNIWTACIPYLSSAKTSTADMDRTRYCSDSKKPFCAALAYTDPIFTGYTIPTCAEAPTTYIISYSSSVVSTTSSKSSLSLSISSSSSSSSSSSGSSTEPPEPNTTGPNNGGITVPPGPNPNPPVEKSTPVGAIVGGVVGGIAALGLIGLGAFFLIRKKNEAPTAPSPGAPPMAMAPPPPGPGPHDPNFPGGPPQPYPNQMPSPQPSDMTAVPPTAAGGYYDPRYSMVKPPLMDPSVNAVSSMTSPTIGGISPTNSPPPGVYPAVAGMGAMHAVHGTPSPPPPGQMGPPPPHMQQQHAPGVGMGAGPAPPAPFGSAYQGGGAPPSGVVELPTQRGDGQVYEMDSGR